MGDKELISIIIPFYKGNEYLDRLLNSINKVALYIAKFINIEVVLVNDSPDIKIEIPQGRDYIFPIIIRENKINLGIHKTRIEGLNHSSGKWILFLDQDDELICEGFKKQVNLIREADVIVGNGFYQYDDIYGAIYNNLDIMKYLIQKDNFIKIRNLISSPGQCLIKKSKIPKIWIESPLSINGADDWMLWILLFNEKCFFLCNSDPVYKHNNVNGNLSLDLKLMHSSCLEMVYILKDKKILSKKEIRVLSKAIDFKFYQDNHMYRKICAIKYVPTFFDMIKYKIKRFQLR